MVLLSWRNSWTSSTRRIDDEWRRRRRLERASVDVESWTVQHVPNFLLLLLLLEMHLHFEEPSSQLRCDSVISSLSWMGRVPDEQPEGHGWKLNRTSYYQEGWLAVGNLKSVVGVTFTSTLPLHSTRSDPPHLPLPPRTNYNLRGHRAQISLVRWNEPYQKLATCDASGIIFVWIRYEGRWSIELINDRNTPVTHFSWSHDGRMAVIAYQDGFVLVGSVAGQRYWSTVLGQESVITTGTWTPDDQQVYLGTLSGAIVVLDVHNGAVVAQIQMADSSASNGIRQLAWNCPRFKMEEPTTSTNRPATTDLFSSAAEDQHVLAVLTFSGRLSLIKGFDDVHPCCTVDGHLSSPMMEWNNDGELLCLAGHNSSPSNSPVHYANILLFYNSRGLVRFRIAVPYTQAPITSLTWGHNDRRLFVATGCAVHVAWVSPRRMASLQHLARLKLSRCLSGPDQLQRIAHQRMPRLISNLVLSLFASTVHCHVPEEQRLRDYICRPPPGNTRLYCTMIRRDDEETDEIDPIDPTAQPAAQQGTGVAFTLYLEFLGGLIPLLKGKPTSRIRPEFVIYDPHRTPVQQQPLTKSAELLTAPSRFQQLLSPSLQRKFRRRRAQQPNSSASDSETDESCVSTPRLQRKFAGKKQQPAHQSAGEINDTKIAGQEALAEVASNIWGTRFKISGLSPCLPAHLGQVTYKTSLLHLQPRQMTLGVVDLRDPSPGGEVTTDAAAGEEDDDEEEMRSNPSPPIVPLSTPNLRRKRMEPPPSPTHHRRPPVQHDEWNERIVLSAPAVRWRSLSAGQLANNKDTNRIYRRRKSRSLDSSPVPAVRPLPDIRSSWAVQIRQQQKTEKNKNSSFRSRVVGSQILQQQSNNRFARLSPLFGRRSEPNTPNSSPALGRRRNNSANKQQNDRRQQSPIRQLLNSPLLARRLGKSRFAAATAIDSSDDDIDEQTTTTTTVHNFHDLESFQKAQLLNKLRQTWIAEKNAASSNEQTKRRREFVLNNKAPLWNEHSQVYQLDFGGRVTQESAKNFQIEFKGKQVMQFGRIDGNAYTLDFQYPFSAVQAFAVALANVTQRLK